MADFIGPDPRKREVRLHSQTERFAFALKQGVIAHVKVSCEPTKNSGALRFLALSSAAVIMGLDGRAYIATASLTTASIA
jgi:hypothetical protein